MNKVERGHQMYREARYSEALGLYWNALTLAKTKAQKIALHSNRAACFLKLQLFKEAAEECSCVLELDHNHTGALMLRAQTLVTLKDYQSALFDVNQLLQLNPSSQVYLNLQARLKSQLVHFSRTVFCSRKSLAPIPEVESELEEEDEHITEEEEDIIEALLNAHYEQENRNGMQQESSSEAVTFEKPKTGDVNTPDGFSTLELNSDQKSSDPPTGCQTVPKPKGLSRLDYSRWDSVKDDSSEEEEDDDEETHPQYRFRVKTVDLRPVK